MEAISHSYIQFFMLLSSKSSPKTNIKLWTSTAGMKQDKHDSFRNLWNFKRAWLSMKQTVFTFVKQKLCKYNYTYF